MILRDFGIKHESKCMNLKLQYCGVYLFTYIFRPFRLNEGTVI